MKNYPILRKYIRKKIEETYSELNNSNRVLEEEIALINHEKTAVTLVDDSTEGIDLEKMIKNVSRKFKERGTKIEMNDDNNNIPAEPQN